MTPFDDQLRDNTARNLVNVCQRLQRGKTITYEGVPLYGMPRGEASIISAEELGTDTDQETRVFEIPWQSAAGELVFPPLDGAGNPVILTGDKLVWKGKTYSVQTFTIESYDALFVLTCLAIRPTLIGMPTK